MYDEICNDNCQRLKSFSQQFKMYMPQTHFECSLDERISWHSPDKKTKKILDYILVPKFINQYITDCHVKSKLDFERDHRLLITALETPKEKKRDGNQHLLKLRILTSKN